MPQKLNLAVVSGGLNEEREISLKSAGYILDHLDRSKYHPYLLFLDGSNWYVEETKSPVNKNDFSIKDGNQHIHFDAVVLMIHGTPIEDGRLQGYFEMQGLRHTTCDTLCSAITFNKRWSKEFLVHQGIRMPDSIALTKKQWIRRGGILNPEFSYPLFVKPNQNGSSVGISRVNQKEDLGRAIDFAFEYDSEILVEEGIEGREFSCGVMEYQGTTIAFPITEIIPYNEFFDYGAKYLGESDEITPADLSPKLTVSCQDISKRAYEILQCSGVVRMDYMLKGDTFYLLEVNTVPGLSPQSIIPQQARAYGWTDKQLVEAIIQTAVRN